MIPFYCKRGLIQVKSQHNDEADAPVLDCKRGLIQVKSQLSGGTPHASSDCKRGLIQVKSQLNLYACKDEATVNGV